MSFILDALKKSEAERQRQSGPTLLELRITHPRRRYPIWALVVGGLLAVNALVLLVVLLRRPAPLGVTQAAAAAGASAAGAPTPAAAAPAAAAKTASAVPVPVPVQAVAPLVGSEGASAQNAPAATIAAPPTAPATAQSAAGPADLAARDAASPPPNPADYEPALARPSVTLQAATDYESLPSLSTLSGVPSLQLDLLDWSDRPAERYALINMHRVREGDVLPEGARVLAILRDGVAMQYHGQDFLLRSGVPSQ